MLRSSIVLWINFSASEFLANDLFDHFLFVGIFETRNCFFYYLFIFRALSDQLSWCAILVTKLFRTTFASTLSFETIELLDVFFFNSGDMSVTNYFVADLKIFFRVCHCGWFKVHCQKGSNSQISLGLKIKVFEINRKKFGNKFKKFGVVCAIKLFKCVCTGEKTLFVITNCPFSISATNANKIQKSSHHVGSQN